MSSQKRSWNLAGQELPRWANGSRHLRIIFVTGTYPTAATPQTNIFTHRAIKALSSELEIEVINLCAWKLGRPFVSRAEYDGVPVVSVACPRIPSGKAIYINALVQAHFGKYLIQSYLRNADVIHAATLFPAGFVATQWARKARKPCTAHAIGSDVNFLLPQAMRTFFFQPLWHFDGIACESKDMMGKVLSLFPNSQNVRVIYRGINTEEFSSLDVQAKNIFPHTPLRFLFLGGFHTWDASHPFYNIKGGPIMLQAWHQIEHQIAPDVLIVGGPHVDVYRAHLENWRSSLSRPEAVRFLQTLHPDAVPEAIRASDVVVIPSLFEGLPNLAKEAQACGRPILGTDAGGIPEAVLHDKTGIIVPRGNVDALASGFLWFHAHKNRIKQLGINARDHIVREFSWKDFSTNMTDFFRAAIKLHESERH
ncbi:MAG TPA: glycosyltransferase family 4 protein [Anaerolineales bacterium]|nr:glycosyltransferase family 4 protein [Anaerolineales bacterium]